MKESLLEFYVNKFCFFDSLDNVDISFIPPILRRKTATVDKFALSSVYNVYSKDIENIVFSSQYGEVERLLKIIEQYNLNSEISPNVFSASVHNYPVGFFLFNIKKSIPYTALSATSNSISSGLLASIVSNYNNTLFCYCDVNKGETNSLAINISKVQKENSKKYRLILKDNAKLKDDFEEYVRFFREDINSLKTSLFELERIS